jgi:hypothetical protein
LREIGFFSDLEDSNPKKRDRPSLLTGANPHPQQQAREKEGKMATPTMSAEQLLEACLGWQAQIETGVLALPWFVTAGIFAIGQVYGSVLIQMFSGFLFLTHYTFVAINGGLNQTFNDPICPLNAMLGGLSHVTFYATALTVFVLLFHAYKRKYPGWGPCIFLTIALGVPLVLVWFGVRTAASVGITLVVSVLLTCGFFAFAVGINAEPQWLVRTGIVEAFHYTSFDLLLTKDQKKQLELDRRVTKRVTSFCKKKDEWKNGIGPGPIHTARNQRVLR